MQAEDAARAHDRVAIAMGRPLTSLNFHHSNYSHEMKTLQELGKSEVITLCRRQGRSSEYRGVSLHKRANRFECRIQDDEKKNMYLGLFDKVKKY